MSTHPDAHKPHPPGLFVLSFAEMWERFSYYGMRAMLVLYMTARTREQMAESCQVPESGQIGFGWTDAEAIGLYGTYTMLVYITPMLGGWVADNLIGQRKSIVLGGLLMVAGHFLMAFQYEWAFFTALGLIILGNGFFKPNISTMVGQFYQQGDPRRDRAFTIFYMGINAGAFLAPIVCGTLRDVYGFHYGFAAAGVGMLIGQIIFQYNPKKFFGEIGLKASEAAKQVQESVSGAKQRYDRVMGYRIYSIIFMVAFIVFGLFTAGNATLMYGYDQVFSLTVKVSSNNDCLIDQCVVRVVAADAPGEMEFANAEGGDSTLMSDYEFTVGRSAAEPMTLGTLQPNAVVKHTVSEWEGGVEGSEIVAETMIDPTEGKTFRYEVLEGNVGGMFTLDEQTGELKVAKPELLSHRANAMLGGSTPGTPVVALGLMALLTAGLFFGYSHFNGKVSAGRATLSKGERQELTNEGERVLAIFILAVFNIFFWAGFEQAGGLMNLYTDRYTDRFVMGYEIPTEWFQALNAVFILAFGLPFTLLWGRLNDKGKEPNTPLKFGYGLLLVGVGFLFMAGSAYVVKLDDAGNALVKGGMHWVVFAYLFHTWGELCLSPVGLSMVTKLAPAAFGSLLMGIWFFSMSLGNKLAGVIGQFSESLDAMSLFLSIAGGEVVVGLLMVALSGTVHKLMHGRA